MNDNLELVKIIKDRINSSLQQRITFADYMQLVLYHPQHGYYASSSNRISKSGDFLTSPHLADDFGEMVAIQLYQFWEILGHPSIFTIVEMGAGQGLLASQILSYSRQEYPDFFESIDYLIIEAASAMIVEQKDRLKSFSVRWCEWVEIDDHSIVGCFLSNELIDALPVHQVVTIDGTLQEIYVSIEHHNLTETIGELSTDRLNQYWQLNNINLLTNRYPNNYRTEVNLAALDWLEIVDRKLQRGYILSIDYGYTADRYYNPMRSQGTLQCYHQHSYHNDPYINIGHQDLTAHVDFTAIQNYGERLGLNTQGITQQGIFLMALGLVDRIAEISHSNKDLKSLLIRRQNLHQLIDPMGLGKFLILLQSKALTATELVIIPTGYST